MTNPVLLSPHFTLQEMVVSQTAARYGMSNVPDAPAIAALRETAVLLEEVRALFGGSPIIVTSGYRSPMVNKLVGGAANSQHLTGHAADFVVPAIGDPHEVCKRISESAIQFDQLIYEFDSWTHISWSMTPRRQVLTIDALGTMMGLHR